MSELDLIPTDYARVLALRRRARALLASVAAIAAVALVARTGLGILLSAEKGEVARLQAKKLLWHESKTKTEKLKSEVQATEKQLAALDELRGRGQMRLFLEALDNAYVDKIWVDEIKYYRREAMPADAAQSGARNVPVVANASGVAPAAQRMEQRASVVGHAMNHLTLAEFMKKLERQRAVADLGLVDTSPRVYPHAIIIDFKLALLMEQKAKAQP
jgi:hypothetical protein